MIQSRAAFVSASILALAVLLAGCSPGGATPPPSSPIVSASPTGLPTATPVPSVVVLGAAAESALGVAVESWAREHGWGFAAGAAPGDEPGSSGAVAVAPDPSSIESIRALSVWLILVDAHGFESGGNVSTIGGTIRRDQAGFLAGVLAGMASGSGWVGRIDGTEGDGEVIYAASFAHGLRYACPRCQLVSAPPREATAGFFRGNGVDVVWAVPGPAADAALAPLAEGGLWIVWVERAPAGVRPEQIAGGVGFAPEAVVGAALDAAVAGEAGRDWPYDVANGSLGFTGLNREAVSPGRERLLMEALEALSSGALDTGIDPQTGEER